MQKNPSQTQQVWWHLWNNRWLFQIWDASSDLNVSFLSSHPFMFLLLFISNLQPLALVQFCFLMRPSIIWLPDSGSFLNQRIIQIDTLFMKGHLGWAWKSQARECCISDRELVVTFWGILMYVYLQIRIDWVGKRDCRCCFTKRDAKCLSNLVCQVASLENLDRRR